jgi:hypothetical protein
LPCLKHLEPAFFFLQGGIDEALYRALCRFQHPVEAERYSDQFEVHPFFHDLDQYLCNLEDVNALPQEAYELMDNLEFAAAALDEEIYNRLSLYFGSKQFKVQSVCKFYKDYLIILE